MIRRRLKRWMAVALLVIIGAYFALDVFALRSIESQAAGQLVRALAAEEATVDLGNVPFLPSFLRGRIGQASISVSGASAADLRIQAFDAQLSDVRFSWGRIFSLVRSRFGTSTEIKGVDPFATVEIHEADLESFLARRQPAVRDVQISTAGIDVSFGDESEEASARFLPRIEDQRLHVRLVGTSGLPDRYRQAAEGLEIDLPIPEVPGELRGDIRLSDSIVIVELVGQALTFEVGNASR